MKLQRLREIKGRNSCWWESVGLIQHKEMLSTDSSVSELEEDRSFHCLFKSLIAILFIIFREIKGELK